MAEANILSHALLTGADQRMLVDSAAAGDQQQAGLAEDEDTDDEADREVTDLIFALSA